MISDIKYQFLIILLRFLVKRQYVLGIQWENNIANIFARLDCEYERFDKIYPSDDTWSYTVCHCTLSSYSQYSTMRGISNVWRLVKGLVVWCLELLIY